MTMEQVVTQLQQDVFTLKAQVAGHSGLADSVRTINNLATAHVRKDTPSLIDVNGLGRPKEFTDREEDFQQWSKKAEAFFAGVIKEFEMVLVWSAEHATEITTTAIDLEFLPTDECGTRSSNLEFVLQQMHTAVMDLASYGSNDTVANSRKNPSRSDDRWKETKPVENDHFSWKVLSSGTSSGDRNSTRIAREHSRMRAWRS